MTREVWGAWIWEGGADGEDFAGGAQLSSGFVFRGGAAALLSFLAEHHPTTAAVSRCKVRPVGAPAWQLAVSAATGAANSRQQHKVERARRRERRGKAQ